MSSRDGAQIKRERLNQITRLVASYFPEPVNYEKVILWIQVELGLSEATAKKYLDLIVASRRWIHEGEFIKPGETVE